MPAAPSWSSAERTRAGSFSPVATMTSAPGRLERVGRARAARRARRRRSAAPRARPRTSWESSGRRAVGVEDDAARLARGRRRSRAVSCGSSASAVPIPTATASTLGAPAVRAPARLLAGDPLRVAGARGDLAVERHRGLEEHPRAAGARVLAERLVEQPRAGGELAVGDLDLDRPRRAGSRGRGRTPSRSGRRRRRRRGAMPAATIASVHGGVLPWWQHGSSET